ncbi:MAG: hypothetical protein OKBPIBMD_01011 [Chlorobi bacterium]|nr:hypothetical protein [Chlorobiota bacterium]
MNICRHFVRVVLVLLCVNAVVNAQTLIGGKLQLFDPVSGNKTVVQPGLSSGTDTLMLPATSGKLLAGDTSRVSAAWLVGRNDLTAPANNTVGSTSAHDVILIAGGTASANQRLILSASSNTISTSDGGGFRFAEPVADGGNFTAFIPAAQPENIVYTLPKSAPALNQFLKATEVAGSNVTLGWAVVSGSGSHYVGEHHAGGIVFWVDSLGNHGLIVSMIDLDANEAWSNVDSVACGNTTSDDGKVNTANIIAQTDHTSSAAKLCDDYFNVDYGTGRFNDWYLPSRDEFELLKNSNVEVENALSVYGAPATLFDVNVYWTSTETDNKNSIAYSFDTYSFVSVRKNTTHYVRAIRSF